MSQQPIRAVALDPQTLAGKHAIAELMQDPSVTVIDRIEQQLDDLLHSRHPRATATERASARANLLGRAPVAQYGSWWWYPWRRALVHVLPGTELREARLARNRDKITMTEQAVLSQAAIAVVGQSSGRAITTVLAQEGVGAHFRLADGDGLALSNLNRVTASLMDISTSKAVLTARALAEIDPNLDVDVFGLPGRGLDTSDTSALDSFLGVNERQVNLLIDACDDIAGKIRLRARARQLGIPVLMETSERGTLDVERFDREPNRPLLHGLLDHLHPEDFADLEARKELVARLLPHMRTRTRRAVAQVGLTLASWPQLASEVALGAALMATAARRVLLGHPMPSGRYLVDLDATLGGADDPAGT